MNRRKLPPGWRTWLTHVLLFIGCLGIYLANNRLLLSGDSLPTSIWVFNLLENHRLTFDNLQHTELFQRGIGHSFMRSLRGDWVTMYPIGPALLTAPLYSLFYLVHKLSHGGAPIELLTQEFEMQRQSYERLAAAVIAAGSVVGFWQLLKFRFRAKLALIMALLFGFATTTWSNSSQALWQHGPLNFCVILSLWFVLRHKERASNAQGESPPTLARDIFLAGAACGLLLGIRPTAMLYGMPVGLYVMQRKQSMLRHFIGGAVFAALPILTWNIYHFGHPVGGYSTLVGFHNLKYFTRSLPGLLLSPSRGFFIYTPVMLFVLPGLRYWFSQWQRRRATAIDYLFGGTFAASLVIFASYWFVLVWWGGGSYGPRFYTDILPAWCLMLAYCMEHLSRLSTDRVKQFGLTGLFGLTALFSLFTQAVGIGIPRQARAWNITPYSVDLRPNKAWNWSYPQFWHNFRALHYHHYQQWLKTPAYRKQFRGKILAVQTERDKNLASNSPLTIRITPTHIHYVFLRAQLQNRGQLNWLGYQYGSYGGMPYVRCRLYDRHDQLLGETQLFVPGKIPPQSNTQAIGAMHLLPPAVQRLKQQSDNAIYRLEIQLMIYGFHTPIVDHLSYTVRINPEFAVDTF